MNDEVTNSSGSLSWLEKLSLAFSGEPSSRNELIELLRASERRDLLDAEALSIIEGALVVSDMQVREIMIPKSQVVFVRSEMSPDEFLPIVIKSGHSRFPVVSENTDDVVGILLAKDLLPLAIKDRKIKFNLRDLLRRSSAIPESKRLNVLLEEFRTNHNHLAVVYDEYGGVSGIVTIEDVLEQIVGDIEDEFDIEDEGFIKLHSDGSYTIKALIPISEFNEEFGADFSDLEVGTMGGVVTQSFGHLPRRDEEVEIEGFRFQVLNADSRRIHLLKMTRGEKE